MIKVMGQYWYGLHHALKEDHAMTRVVVIHILMLHQEICRYDKAVSQSNYTAIKEHEKHHLNGINWYTDISH
jgi:hypothetical protein